MIPCVGRILSSYWFGLAGKRRLGDPATGKKPTLTRLNPAPRGF